MAGRPSQRIHGKYDKRDLNILPVLNVFCILIPFLLLSASFVSLTIVDTALPARGKPDQAQAESSAPDKPKLTLTVFIRDEGFTLAGYGGVLDVGDAPAGEGDASTANRFVIEKKNGEYDWDKLLGNLKKVKESFPQHYSIILLPDNEISYGTIVKVMDISREYESTTPDGGRQQHWLFPSPVLAWSVK
ncbi:biopolymer transporter ExbD [bacterium]|nr:biopolymer transporter ExbD [bacterium]